MMARLIDKIDWKSVEEETEKVFCKLKSELDLNEFNLETLKPYVDIFNHPPRIVLGFTPKGSLDVPYFVVLSGDQEKELKDNQDNLGEIVARIAERYGLRASKGFHDSFDYTFKLNYDDFKR